MMMLMDDRLILKLVLAGSGGIGKTTFIQTWCGHGYTENTIMTIGLGIGTRRIEFEGIKLTFLVYDMSGQERFRFLLPKFFQGVDGIILGFDVSTYTSFCDLKHWFDIISTLKIAPPTVLVGFKQDLGYHPIINNEKVQDFEKGHRMVGFTEVSSKKGFNLDAPIQMLIPEMVRMKNKYSNIVIADSKCIVP
jgi:Ras-related protein Rab-12